MMDRVVPPCGNVAFLFTDIEGYSARMDRNPNSMTKSMTVHNELLRQAIVSTGGFVFGNPGDSFCAAFPSSYKAVQAALKSQLNLLTADWRDCEPVLVRMAIHVGSAEPVDGNYNSPEVVRTQRLMDAGHGGQILLSAAAFFKLGDFQVDNVTIDKLGTFHLSDLERPETIYSIVHPSLPVVTRPLRTLEVFETNLPRQLTRFIGRRIEIETACSLVREHPVVCLTGCGGTGKTRLALQVGAQLLRHFADGVLVVSLVSANDYDTMLQVLAAASGAKEMGSTGLFAAILDELKSKNLLLILDNCEQIVAESKELIGKISVQCPKIRILVTSRIRLGVPGERRMIVPVMDLPQYTDNLSVADAMKSTAVQLFVDRAEAGDSDFGITEHNSLTIGKICTKLDGIPLALELAAARTITMSVESILHLLKDRFRLLRGSDLFDDDRQRTLYSTIDWSFHLLPLCAKQALMQMSLFVGGWNLDAAISACGDEDTAMDSLSALISASLVYLDHSRNRYNMLDSIREYGATQILKNADLKAETQDRINHFFVTRAEEIGPYLQSADQKPWLDQIDGDYLNFRTVIDNAPADQSLKLCSAIQRYWLIRSNATDGIRCVSKCLYQYSGQNQILLASGLKALGNLQWSLMDLTASKATLTQCLKLYEAAGDTIQTAIIQMNLANVSYFQLDFAESEKMYSSCAKIFEENNLPQNYTIAINNLAAVYLETGHFAEAETLLNRLISEFEAHTERRTFGAAYCNLGFVYLRQQKFEIARNMIARGFSIFLEVDDMRNALIQFLHSVSAWNLQDLPTVAQLVGFSIEMIKRSGISRKPYEANIQTSLDWLRKYSVPVTLEHNLAIGAKLCENNENNKAVELLNHLIANV